MNKNEFCEQTLQRIIDLPYPNDKLRTDGMIYAAIDFGVITGDMAKELFNLLWGERIH